ncbi:MAG: flagellar hook-basal body complex protein FliE [Deltaproteobacteria bacterium]|nr:flagellar hook-basal body complex protein FliE [Deltaproteobacteria bacterium]
MTTGKVIQPQQMPRIGNVSSGEFPGKVGLNKEDKPESFTDLMVNGVKKVDATVKEYEAISDQFAKGESINLHELVLKGEHADLSLRLMATIKNKVVEAYKEVMRMSV